MQSKEFFEALKALEEEKNIKGEYFIEALEAGLTAAYKKIYGEAKKAKVKLNPEKNTIKIYSYKTVVENVEDPEKEISLQDAKLIKKSYKVGDEILQEENSKDFGRVPSSTVKHVILQKLREVTRSQDHINMASKEGQIITLPLMRYEKAFGNYYFNMNGMEIECVLSDKEVIPGEKLMPGSMVKLYVKKIVDTPRGVQVVTSRRHFNFVKRLFEAEIPEIQSGDIYVYAVSREAGVRSKVALATDNNSIDVIGACVGAKGVRLMPIIKELHGEKIDLIPYSSDPLEFIANSLSPATVQYIDQVDEVNKSARVIVPDDALSLAIGAGGLNVKLASKLTGWKLDVKSVSQAENNNENLEGEQSTVENVDADENVNNVTEETSSDDDLFGDIEE